MACSRPLRALPAAVMCAGAGSGAADCCVPGNSRKSASACQRLCWSGCRAALMTSHVRSACMSDSSRCVATNQSPTTAPYADDVLVVPEAQVRPSSVAHRFLSARPSLPLS